MKIDMPPKVYYCPIYDQIWIYWPLWGLIEKTDYWQNWPIPEVSLETLGWEYVCDL